MEIENDSQPMQETAPQSLPVSLLDACAGCHREITPADQQTVKALDRLWHSACMRCSDCDTYLNNKCYVKDQRVLCIDDYFRRYGPKCVICQQQIPPTEMIHKINSRVYHLSCLQCVVCKRQLTTGDEFLLLQDGNVICKLDYEESEDGASTEFGKAKRARTYITSEQLSSLKSSYFASSKPSLSERERIARETGLDMRVVQVWFQNRRAKEKRLRNKAQFPWLPEPRSRVRSHTWSPGVANLPQIRFSSHGSDELEYDIDELKEIKYDLATGPTYPFTNDIRCSTPESPLSLTSETTLEGSSHSPNLTAAEFNVQTIAKSQVEQNAIPLNVSSMAIFQQESTLAGSPSSSLHSTNISFDGRTPVSKPPNEASTDIIPLWLGNLTMSTGRDGGGEIPNVPENIDSAADPNAPLRMLQMLQNSFMSTTTSNK